MKISKISNGVYIGTSGWQYKHWQGVFYPDDLEQKDLFYYYTRFFKTVEINSSFYHLPKKATFAGWAKNSPEDFLYALKVWRRITHLKKLKNIGDDLNIFYERASVLGKKFGPLLFQFPPSFKAREETMKRLEKLGQLIRVNSRANSRKFASKQCAFEFRHASWFSKKVYEILRKYNLSLAWADTPSYPYKEEVTADYVYIRLHGHEVLYDSKYTLAQLKEYARKIKKLRNLGKDVYVYFDNDARGYAVKNAKELKCLLKL